MGAIGRVANVTADLSRSAAVATFLNQTEGQRQASFTREREQTSGNEGSLHARRPTSPL